MCSANMLSLPAAHSSGSLCSIDLILKLLHINSSISLKLLCEIVLFYKFAKFTVFDEFSNATKCFFHMTVTDFISCFTSYRCRWKP